MKFSLAVIGPEYSYSHLLALKISETENIHFTILLTKNIAEVFQLVADGKAEQGLVPLENSISGRVPESILGLTQQSLKICQKYLFSVQLCLAAQGKDFRSIASHPQALKQCSDFLQGKDFLRNKNILESSSTSQAMLLAKQDKNIAAIGAKEAAQAYGLHILKKDIGNSTQNITTFILLRSK